MAEKKIKTVLELAQSLGEDEAFSKDLGAHLNKRRLVHKLTSLRAARGFTQKDIADKIGCTQGRISKLETSEDLNLNFGTIVKYAQAIGFRLDITLMGTRTTAVDRIKHHGFRIKELTDRLARLALADEAIAKGVSHFFNEAAFNLLQMLQDSAQKLPPSPEEPTPGLTVDTCGVDEREGSSQEEGQKPRRKSKTSRG